MRSKMISVSTKVIAAMLVAASVITTAAPMVYAEENPVAVEEVQDTKEESSVAEDTKEESTAAENEKEVSEVAEAPAVESSEVEGQGDVIDDQFAVVEGQGDVIDDQFVVVEGQGDVIDDQLTVVEGQGDVIDDQLTVVEGQGDVIDDQLAVVEGQGDVIDDQLAVVEGQGDVIDDQFTVDQVEEERKKQFDAVADEVNKAMMDSMKGTLSDTTKEEPKKEKKEAAPKIDMGILSIFTGYHGTRVDYKDLVPGKYYLMQIPRRTKIPTFSYKVVKILGSYTNKGFICDDVMVKYNKYNNNGKLIAKNKETQVNENIFNLTPNHFYEITDDILVK